MKKKNLIVCSFCGVTEEEAKIIIVSKNNKASICDECVDLARDFIGSERIKERVK